MNWSTILAWVQANWPWIATILLIVVGLGLQIARGRGKALAQLALDFLLLEARKSIDEVTKEELTDAVGYLYDAAPGVIWLIPWKILVGKALVLSFAWDAFNKLHGFLDSAGSVTLRKGIVRSRNLRAIGHVEPL